MGQFLLAPLFSWDRRKGEQSGTRRPPTRAAEAFSCCVPGTTSADELGVRSRRAYGGVPGSPPGSAGATPENLGQRFHRRGVCNASTSAAWCGRVPMPLGGLRDEDIEACVGNKAAQLIGAGAQKLRQSEPTTARLIPEASENGDRNCSVPRTCLVDHVDWHRNKARDMNKARDTGLPSVMPPAAWW